MMTLEQLMAAADSYVGARGASSQAYADAVELLSERTLVECWVNARGSTRTLGDLLLLLAEIDTAGGAYRDLIEASVVGDAGEFSAEQHAQLMLSGGTLEPVAETLATLFAQVRGRYLALVGDEDDVSDELADLAAALRRGPLDEGGYFPYGHWPHQRS